MCASLYFVFWLQYLLPQGMEQGVEFASISYYLEASSLMRCILAASKTLLAYLLISAAAQLADGPATQCKCGG